MTTPHAYLLRIVSEPGEDPIPLTQADFNVLLDLGSRHVRVTDDGGTVDFATIETIDHGPFLYRDAPIADGPMADLLGRALAEVLHAVLADAAARTVTDPGN
jgi:hypothetical protein